MKIDSISWDYWLGRKEMASIASQAATVSIFNMLYDSVFVSRKPVSPKESLYKRRIDCLNNLARIQGELRDVDEEYITVSFAEGKGHENAMKRMECLTKEYRSTWDRCEGIIRPK